MVRAYFASYGCVVRITTLIPSSGNGYAGVNSRCCWEVVAPTLPHNRSGAIRRAVLGEVDSIEHGTYMDDEDIRLTRSHGTWYVPTLIAGKYVAEKAGVLDL